jgi:MFS-type transporter involved in bile tolerance (Atg22 family)
MQKIATNFLVLAWLFCSSWLVLINSFPGRSISYARLYSNSLAILDAVNTTGQVVAVIQNNLVNFGGSLLTFFGLVQAIASIVGCLAFLYIQKYFKLQTKTMLQVSNVFTLMVPIWGCIGLGSKVIGFHDVREMWVYHCSLLRLYPNRHV